MKYTKQFAILKRPLELPEFEHLRLKDGWILSYHRLLRIYYHAENDVLLLGLAWQTKPGGKSPIEEIDALRVGADGAVPLEDIFRMEETWCGRYAIVSASRVFLDATGKMGIFYCGEGISCSLPLLAEACGLEEKIHAPGSSIMYWLPTPKTQYPEIRHCFASQIYHYQTGELRSRPLLAQFSVPDTSSEQEILEELIRCFDQSFHNMEQTLTGYKPLIALTGGKDSRVLFALAEHAGLKFDSFTLEHPWMSDVDRVIPKILCDRLEEKYLFIPRDEKRYNPELEKEYQRFIGGLTRDQDRLFYAHSQYQDVIREYGKVVFLRSSVWETADNFYEFLFDGSEPMDIFYDWFLLKEGSLEKESLREYFAWYREHPQPGMEPAVAYFVDEDESCWMSPIEGGFDIFEDAYSIQMANCRHIITLLLRFPKPKRVFKIHEEMLTRLACPAIGDVTYGMPDNKKVNKLVLISKKVDKCAHRLKALGLKKTIRIYKFIYENNKRIARLKQEAANMK